MSTATKKSPKVNEINMCEGKILPQILKFAFPLIVIGIVQLFYSAADMIVVGTFAQNADHSLAAVGSTSALINLITMLFTGMSAGANVLCARFYGSKDYDKLTKVVHTSVIFSTLLGAILTVIGLLIAKKALIFMNTPTDILPLATLYIRIYFLGMIPVLLYNFCAAILRSVGATKQAMYILLISGAANVILNIAFVAGLHLDVMGVALATFISQTLSAVLILAVLIRYNGPIKLALSKLGIDKNVLLGIVRIGLPTGIQNTMFGIANAIIQKSINAYDIAVTGGSGAVVAGCSAASNIDNISITVALSITSAFLSFTSQNFGAHNFERIKQGRRYGFLLMLTLVLGIGTLSCIFAKELLGLFVGNASAETIAIGSKCVIFVGGCSFIYGCALMSSSGMQGLGVSVIPMITSLICICGVRVLWVYTAFQVWYDIQVMYMAFSLSFIALFIVNSICFSHTYKKMKKHYDELQSSAVN